MARTVLGAVTNFSFLRGASHPHDMITTAADMGWQAIGISDYGTMAGMVRAHVAAQQAGISLLVGVCLQLIPDKPVANKAVANKAVGGDAHHKPLPDIIIYARNRSGYGVICQLLSHLNMSYERPKDEGASQAVKARFGDLARLTDDVIVIIQPPFMPHDTTKADYQKNKGHCLSALICRGVFVA